MRHADHRGAAGNLILALNQEGTDERPSCVRSTARVEVALTVSGGTGVGSSTYVSQKTGSACNAGETQLSRSLLSTFTVNATHP